MIVSGAPPRASPIWVLAGGPSVTGWKLTEFGKRVYDEASMKLEELQYAAQAQPACAATCRAYEVG